MKIFEWIKEMVQYLGKGVARLLSPSEDDYPKTGVQPFEGEPYDETKNDF